MFSSPSGGIGPFTFANFFVNVVFPSHSSEERRLLMGAEVPATRLLFPI
jgi:hypothetical protein